jgi:uncharacterized membrane protein YwaF
MLQIALFSVLASMLLLFAVSAARAGEFLIAIPSAVLAAWMLSMLRQVMRLRRRGSAR